MTIVDVLPPVARGMAAEGNSSNGKASIRSTVEQAELAQIGAQIGNAQTLAEIMEVKAALRAWTKQRPEERTRLSAVFEQLAMLEDSAREAQAEAEVMRLTPEECQQREQLFALRRRVRAEDAPELFAAALCNARDALANWEAIHPEDSQLPHLRAQLDTEAYVAHALQQVGE